jgi:outer membrane protein assembly factor BamB
MKITDAHRSSGNLPGGRSRRGLVGLATLVLLVTALGVATPTGAQPRAAASGPAYTWSKYAHDAGDSGVSHDPAVSTANAADLGVKWMVPDQTGDESSPVVAYDKQLGKTVVYQGNEAGSFTAFDAATGAILWSQNLGSAVTSTPLVANGDVWVARSFSPVLYKLDGATGAVVCHSAPLQSINYATPTIGTPPGRPQTVFIGENGIEPDGPVYGIEASNCSTEWTFLNFNSGAGSWDPYSYAVDAHGNGLLLFGSDNPDATVYALNAATGTKVWSYQTQNTVEGDVGTGASVTPPGVNGFADGAVYLSNNGGYTYALDLTTGQPYWRFDYKSFLGPGTGPDRGTAAVLGDHVIVPGPDGVICLDAVTGSVVWSWRDASTQGDDAATDSAAAVVGPPGQQVVAVTDLSGNLDVLSAATGSLLYQHQTGGYAVTSVAESDGNFYVSSGSGFLYDFAVGGSNAPAPSTTVTSPATGSTLTNPAGDLAVTGTATGAAIGGVSVAVQSGGPAGPWWDASTGRWNPGFVSDPAALTDPGASSTGWSLEVPVPPGGGSYSVQASATDADGQADLSAYASSPTPSRSSFVVRYLTSAPHLGLSGSPWVAPGGTIGVVGSGFGSSETVDVALAGSTLLQVTTGVGGSFSGSVPIPATAPFGASALVATGESSARSSSVSIDVSNQWPSSGYGSLHQGYEPDDLTWDQHIVGNHSSFITQAWSYPTGAAVNGAPVVVDDVAYFGDGGGTVTALDVRNSQPVWTFSAGSPVVSSVAVASGLVIVGTRAGGVDALSRATGALVWHTPTSSGVESAPSVSMKAVFVGSDDGTLYSLDQTTGHVLWTRHLGGAVTGSPTVDPVTHQVVVGDGSGAITALSSRTGAPQWSVPTGGPVTATPTIVGGRVFVGSQSGTVYALDEVTGATAWTFTAGAGVSAGGAYWPSGSHTSYVVGDDKGDAYFLLTSTGADFRQLSGTGAVTGVTTANTWVVVTTSAGEAFADKFPGELTWVYQGTGSLAPVTLVDGVAYAAGADGTVRSFTVPGTQIP